MSVTIDGSAPNPTQQQTLQEEFNVLAGSWVINDEAIVGILGPDGTTVYAQFVRQPDGSVQMQIVPRTGTLAALMTTAGSDGELASDTDQGAIVKLSGTAGTQEIYWAHGAGDSTTNVTGTGSVAMLVLDSRWPAHTVTKAAGVTNVTNFGQLSAGTVLGQVVQILNATGISLSLRTNGATAQSLVATNTVAEVRWSGAGWVLVGKYLLSSVGLTIGDGDAQNSSAIAIGGGVASGTSSRTFGGGTASGPSSVAFRNAVASADEAIAFRGTASAGRSTGIGGALAKWQGSIGKGLNNYSGFTVKAMAAEILLGRQVPADEGLALTTDGQNPNSLNTLSAASFTGVLTIRFDFMLSEVASPNRTRYAQKVCVLHSTGTVLTLRGVTDISTTDVGSFVVDGAPDISFGVTSNNLEIYATMPSAYDMECLAHGNILGVYA